VRGRRGSAALTAFMALPAWAQEAAEEVAEEAAEAAPLYATADETAFIFNTLLFLIGGFLVMWMAAGFAMLEAGMVRSKNVSMQCLKNIGLYSIAGLMYWALGYNLMYDGVDGGLSAPSGPIAGPRPAPTNDRRLFGGLRLVLPDGVLRHHRLDRVGHGRRAHQAVALPRLRRHPDRHPLPDHRRLAVGRRLARRDGLLRLRRLDHRALGRRLGGPAGAIVIGARKGKYGADGKVNPIPGSNMPLATLGTFILWLGWFGFNGASQLAMGTIADVSDVSRIFANTNLAAAGGVVAALILCQVVYKKVDITMVLNGALAGLVSITAEPLTPARSRHRSSARSAARSWSSRCRCSTS
jgi:ammonium transporter, Amt family